MRFAFLLSVLLTTLFSFGQKNPKTIGFIENKGQIIDQKGKANKAVQYLLNTSGLNVQLRENGFSYDIYETKKIPLTKKDKRSRDTNSSFKDEKETPDYSLEYNYHRIDIDFLNSNANVKLMAEEKSSDYDNYYNVAHAPEGITNVHKYQKVTYRNIYNNIDAVFFIPKDTTKVVEYNFIVKPGGKVSDIQLKFNGAKTELADNKIKMNVRFGEMEETLPLSWIENGNSRKEISVGYKKIKRNVYGFEGDVNASDKTIVIDPVPVRLWATYYGGSSIHYYPEKIKTDRFENVIITGKAGSLSINIATTGAFQTTNTSIWGSDFMAKLTPNGNRIWGTYINSIETADLVVSVNNDIYIGGNASGQGTADYLTTPGAHKEHNPDFSADCIILKFDSSGQRLWCTFFGGDRFEYLKSMCIDNQENLIITGQTHSQNSIATPGAFQSINNDSFNGCGFFAKFSPTGNQIYGSYFPGIINYSAVDSSNNLILAGQHWMISGQPNISTPGAHQTQIHHRDAFVVKFNSIYQQQWCTYYGGDASFYISVNDYYDQITGLGTDLSDNIYITGMTNSTNNISTPGAFKEAINTGDVDAFMAKFNSLGERQWGTYFGANMYDRGYSCSISNDGNIYIGGDTNSSTGIATPDGYQPSTTDFGNGFFSKFSTNGQLIWGSYYKAITQKIHYNNGKIYLIGGAMAGNLGTPGTFAPNGGGLLVSKFQDCQSSPQATAQNPCIGSNLILSASGGTTYSWTGPNGFTSNQQNPIITNANASHSGQYTCTITGTGGCDGPTSLNVTVGDTTAPVPNITNLPTINGDCNTVISTIPTATDNCAGNITATTTSPLNYSTPGTHTIVWNYNDGNGNTATQNQTVVISATTLPTTSTAQQFCIQQNTTLNDITITGQNIKWYDALTGGNLLANTTLLQNGVTYYASQTINGCESTRVPVTVTIQNTPPPTGNATQSFCSSQNATLNDIVVSGSNLIWYSSAAGTVVLPSTTLLSNNTTYYATQTVNNCESPTRFSVTVTLINTLNANDYAETFCDDLNNGSETVNLSDYNTDLIATTSGNTFTYYHSQNGAENQLSSDAINNFTNYNLSVGNNVIFVRIDSSNGCHQIVELNLTLVSKPIIPITDIMPICEGSSITVNAGNGYDSYLWSTTETTPSIMIFNPGNYSVTVTENHGALTCTSVKNFTVVNSNAATVAEIVTSDWTNNQNTITVLLTGNSVGDYVYSLDGIHYQTSNTFTGLESGEYIVYVKDKNGCGVKSEDFYLLMYPKFFTPNGDGYNDYWKIKLSEKEPDMTIRIFDRYGKLMKELAADSQGWDGTYLGKVLPSNDYWFVVTRENGKEYRGHFSLKR